MHQEPTTKKQFMYSIHASSQVLSGRLILHKKIKFFIKDFFSKCDQIRSFLQI